MPILGYFKKYSLFINQQMLWRSFLFNPDTRRRRKYIFHLFPADDLCNGLHNEVETRSELSTISQLTEVVAGLTLYDDIWFRFFVSFYFVFQEVFVIHKSVWCWANPFCSKHIQGRVYLYNAPFLAGLWHGFAVRNCFQISWQVEVRSEHSNIRKELKQN